MALTLLEAQKLARQQGKTLKEAIISYYTGSSAIFRILPFETIPGGAVQYDTMDTLPGVAFRGVNESYTESTGIVNPQVESVKITGGDLDVDKFLISTRGQNIRTVHERAKAQAVAANWTRAFITGDSVSTPKEFDGLQTRIVGNQLIAAGSTSGGDALSLLKMDELIDQVLDPTHIIMSKAMRRKFDAAARTTGVSGNVNYETTQLGERIITYAGIPIVTVDLDNTGAQILPFTEANPGGGSAASTSIYCIQIDPLGVYGMQNNELDAVDLGEIDEKPVMRTRIDWYTSFAIYNGRSAARLNGIKDAAITA